MLDGELSQFTHVTCTAFGGLAMVRRLCVLFVILVMCLSTAAWANPLFYVANASGGTISAVAADGSKTTVTGGLSSPRGLTMDQSGNFYATNWGTESVVKVDGTTHAVTPIATGLWSPYGITMSTSGDVYFATVGTDSYNNIMKYTPGGTVSTFAAHVGYSTNALTIDNYGNLFACNWYDGTVVKITPDHVVSTYVSGINSPNGVVFDSAGYMYVDEYYSGKLYKVASDGSKALFASGFSSPTGLAFDNANQCLYLANYGGGSISKITLGGTVTTFASGFSSPVAIVMNAVPEPASLALLGGGAFMLLMRRRRRA
jgi:sugar lactone lactonase YvrE